MKLLFGTVIAVISVVLIGGCASTPTTSGYLSDYERLKPGQHLEKYWADTSQIKETDSPVILLGNISVDQITDKKGVSVADCVSWLKSGLEDGGLISSDNTDAPIRIDLAITHMDPGSAAKRIWAAELGAGHAQVQVEGKVVDVERGNLVANFAERRRSSGAIGLKDLGGNSGSGLIARMIRKISDDVNSELLFTFSSNRSH